MKTIVNQIQKHKQQVIEKHMPAKTGVKIENLVDTQAFKQAFDKYCLDKVDKSRFIESDGFHPSALGTYSGKCARNQVYLLRGVEKENVFDARTLRVLETGTHIHEKLQKNFEEMGILIAPEIPVEYDSPPIKGHADGAIKWEERVILLEIKSCNGSTFDARRRYKKPKPEHFDQANIYAYILELEYIWIIYYCKDNEEIEVFECKMNPKAAKKIIDKWEKTYQIFLDGDLPKRPYRHDSKECTYCPLQQTCWSDTEIGV